MKCIQCGRKIGFFDDFCPKCGKNQNPLKAGDIIKFGEWGGKSIEWIVLNVNKREERALLLSKYALERREYHEVLKKITWEDSSIRLYLQKEFINRAFSSEEKVRLVPVKNRNTDNPKYRTSGGNPTWDRVFLLSIEEFKRYFEEENLSQPDEKKNLHCYAVCKNSGSKNVWWWLRSPGYHYNYAADVWSASVFSLHGLAVSIDRGWVRPALYYNLKSGISGNL